MILKHEASGSCAARAVALDRDVIYPDMPVALRWGAGRDALWVPADRAILDGSGRALADLRDADAAIAADLRPGMSKKQMGVQAIAVDLHDDGDPRQDLILYQPTGGGAVIHVVAAADKPCVPRPYRHLASVYNRKSYF